MYLCPSYRLTFPLKDLCFYGGHGQKSNNEKNFSQNLPVPSWKYVLPIDKKYFLRKDRDFWNGSGTSVSRFGAACTIVMSDVKFKNTDQ